MKGKGKHPILEQREERTHWAKRRVLDIEKRVQRVREDKAKRPRIEDGECPACYYLRGRVAGQGFTAYNCQLCEKSFQYPNTATPRLCPECAAKEGLCCRCLGDMNWTAQA